MRVSFRLAVVALALLAAACGRSSGEALEIAVIGGEKDPFETGVRLAEAGQLVAAATSEGLVGLDAQGQAIPALADRWIVTDDGRSYIFRLRDGTWPDGGELTGESARDALRRTIRSLAGTSLGLDLNQISEIRAMAGRVVEIRLKGPMPDFLQLLAQPELGLARRGKGTGPMILRKVEKTAVLAMMPPDRRGLPIVEGWDKTVRELRLRGLSGEAAVAAFDEGMVDLVLNGRIADLPRVDTGPLSRGTVRLDPAFGLFGLAVQDSGGFLGDVAGREALAMAIDRDSLIAPFNIGGWDPTTRLVPAGLPGDLGTIGERWEAMSLDQRRAIARERVAAWRAGNGSRPVALTIELPDGPGADLLLRELSGQLGAVGIEVRRAGPDTGASLVLIDRVARYADASWFLNQFNCRVRRAYCSAAADSRVAEALASADPAERAALFAEAEAELTALNGFIPFGQPVRWSLVRGSVTGYAPNRWAFHPLPELALIPR